MAEPDMQTQHEEDGEQAEENHEEPTHDENEYYDPEAMEYEYNGEDLGAHVPEPEENEGLGEENQAGGHGLEEHNRWVWVEEKFGGLKKTEQGVSVEGPQEPSEERDHSDGVVGYYMCVKQLCTFGSTNRDLVVRHSAMHKAKNNHPCKHPLCGAVFKRMSDLADHRTTTGHSDPPQNRNSYACQVTDCGMSFESKSLLLMHMASFHGGKLYPCPMEGCPSLFSSPLARQQHISDTHVEPLGACRICGAPYTDKLERNTHMQSHVEDDEHACEYYGCSAIFTSGLDLRAHLAVHAHEPYLCRMFGCGATFANSQEYIQHAQVMHGVDLGTEGRHEVHACAFSGCGQWFERQSDFIKHMHGHAFVRIFLCNVAGCHEQCDSQLKLRAHRRKEHPQAVQTKKRAEQSSGQGVERNWLCDHEGCGKAFTSKANLQAHKPRHNGIKAHECPHCPAKFFDRERLKEHINFHTHARPYKCEVCGAGFNYKSNLRLHRKVHQKKVESADGEQLGS